MVSVLVVKHIKNVTLTFDAIFDVFTVDSLQCDTFSVDVILLMNRIFRWVCYYCNEMSLHDILFCPATIVVGSNIVPGI